MIDVVGMGDDGWAGLAPPAKALLEDARIVVGGRRHLALLPSDVGAERCTWPSPLLDALPALLDDVGRRGVVLLASGDPLVSGIATGIIDLLGRDAVRVHPSVSSDALARARMGWSAETTEVVTTVGRDPERIRPFLTPGVRLIVLCSDGTSPSHLARLITDAGAGAAMLTAWWHLGGGQEGSRSARADAWDARPTPDLVVLCVETPPALVPRGDEGGAAGRSDDLFAHDGLITKRDVRAACLARLRPTPGALLWDLGAGSGAVGIEWALAAPRARCIAVERDAERLERVHVNARRFGVAHRLDARPSTNATFLTGLAINPPDDERPDAVFVGGGLTSDVLDAAAHHLRPGGRLVATAVTAESEQLLHGAHRARGGELARIAVETLEPLGRFSGWKPARTVVVWSWTKPSGAVGVRGDARDGGTRGDDTRSDEASTANLTPPT